MPNKKTIVFFANCPILIDQMAMAQNHCCNWYPDGLSHTTIFIIDNIMTVVPYESLTTMWLWLKAIDHQTPGLMFH